MAHQRVGDGLTEKRLLFSSLSVSAFHLRMESDTHGIESGYHFLPHFNSDTDTDSDIVGYDAKWMSRIQIRIRIFT